MQLMVDAALPSFLQERERDKFETEHITAGMFSASFIYVGVGNGWASLSLETPDLKNCDCSFSPNGVIIISIGSKCAYLRIRLGST